MTRTRVYIDGFNFYYRVYKSDRRLVPVPPWRKWLDLEKLASRIAPGEDVQWIGYFTAFVTQNPNDPDQHIRQRAYITALESLPTVEVVPGKFMTTIKKGIPCANPKSLPQEFSVFEEKGSDVNLAIRLVRDASIGAMDHAIVVSNDSDITEAIRMAVSDCGARVTVLSPCVKVNFSLRNVSSHAEILDLKHLKKCQLPDVVTTPAGVTVSRPAAWTVQRTN